MSFHIEVSPTWVLENRAGDAHAEMLAVVRATLASLTLHLPPDTPGLHVFAKQVKQQMEGGWIRGGALQEIRLELAARGHLANEDHRLGRIDEYLGCYFSEPATIVLKIDRIVREAAALECAPSRLLGIVLRHELGHHMAPTDSHEDHSYDCTGASAATCRAETAAQLFCWLTSTDDERSIMRKLSESSGPAYQLYQPFLTLAGHEGCSLISAWQLCESREVVAPFVRGWSAAARFFAAVRVLVQQRHPGMVWPALAAFSAARIEHLVGGSVLPIGENAETNRMELCFEHLRIDFMDPMEVDSLPSFVTPGWKRPGLISFAAGLLWQDFTVLAFCRLRSDPNSSEEQMRLMASRVEWLQATAGKWTRTVFVEDMGGREDVYQAHESLKLLLGRRGMGQQVGPGELPGTDVFPFGAFRIAIRTEESLPRDQEADACFGVTAQEPPALECVVVFPPKLSTVAGSCAVTREVGIAVARGQPWTIDASAGSLRVRHRLPLPAEMDNGSTPVPEDEAESWADATVSFAVHLLRAVLAARTSR